MGAKAVVFSNNDGCNYPISCHSEARNWIFFFPSNDTKRPDG